MEIIQNAPKSDQATLCRVSKLFHALVWPILNRTVTLRVDYRDDHIEAFCHAMVRSPERADSVRSLTFENGFEDCPTDSVIESLQLMRRLEYLFINDYSPFRVVSRFANLTFPNLLSCILPPANPDCWNPHLVQFFSRHSTITHLRLWGSTEGADTAEGSLLPNLR
ncbi:hypothetical protein FB45DRAFT_1063029 [Roridomyces roridus]|uniref:Uncharacterized protein n=1 Tax=Roridomyces roridus TaxID=1738132 RepID=A0AAD7BGE0_9AGAR|nr:hypothetical protein FB45DRAFT_1063029 [Roridomyces roridus]